MYFLTRACRLKKHIQEQSLVEKVLMPAVILVFFSFNFSNI